MKIFKTLDNYVLMNHPQLWILGVHIYLPALIAGLFLLTILGYLLPIDPSLIKSAYYNRFSILVLLIVLVCIAVVILYTVRQVRFNSKRIHHHLPYQFGPMFFVIFAVVMAGVFSLPVAPVFGAWLRANAELEAHGSLEYEDNIDEYGNSLLYLNAPLGKNGKFSYDFKEDVRELKEVFICLSKEYWQLYIYFPLTIAVLLFVVCATEKRDFGWGMLVVALLPTIYGILSGIMTIVYHDFDIDGLMVLLTLFVLITLWLAFSRSSVKPTLSKAFGIAFHLYIPLLVFWYSLYLYDWRFMRIQHFIHFLVIGSMVFGVLLFNNYYKQRYVNPG